MNDKKILYILIGVIVIITAFNIYSSSIFRGNDNTKQLLEAVRTTEKLIKETDNRIAGQIGVLGESVRLVSERIGGMEKEVSGFGGKLQEFGKDVSVIENRTREINTELRKTVGLIQGITSSVDGLDETSEGFARFVKELSKKYNYPLDY